MAAAQKKTTKAPVSAFAKAGKVLSTSVKADESTASLVPIHGVKFQAAIAVVKKMLEAVESTARVAITGPARDRWVAEAMKHERRPENFRAIELTEEGLNDPTAQASVENRKRGTNSPLKDHEVEVLNKYGVPFEEAPMVKGTSVFAINAKYEANEELMNEVGVAIQGIMDRRAITDFIIQPVKRVVSEDTLLAAYRRKPGENDETFRARLNELMDVINVTGIKPVSKMEPLAAMAMLMDEISGDVAIAE